MGKKPITKSGDMDQKIGALAHIKQTDPSVTAQEANLDYLDRMLISENQIEFGPAAEPPIVQVGHYIAHNPDRPLPPEHLGILDIWLQDSGWTLNRINGKPGPKEADWYQDVDSLVDAGKPINEAVRSVHNQRRLDGAPETSVRQYKKHRKRLLEDHDPEAIHRRISTLVKQKNYDGLCKFADALKAPPKKA